MNLKPEIRDQGSALRRLTVAGNRVVVDDYRREPFWRQVQQQRFQSPLLTFGALVAGQKGDRQALDRRPAARGSGVRAVQEGRGVPVLFFLDAFRVRARAGEQTDAEAVDRGVPSGADAGFGQRGEVSPLRQKFDEADANVVLRVAGNWMACPVSPVWRKASARAG